MQYKTHVSLKKRHHFAVPPWPSITDPVSAAAIVNMAELQAAAEAMNLRREMGRLMIHLLSGGSLAPLPHQERQ